VKPVAAVADESPAGNSLSIEELLETLGTNAGAEARAQSETMRRLLSDQQTALRRALRAASEFEEESAGVRREADSLREALRRAEKDLVAEKQYRARDSGHSLAQMTGLRAELARALDATGTAGLRRAHDRRIFLWLSAAAVALAVATTALIVRPAGNSRPDAPLTRGPALARPATPSALASSGPDRARSLAMARRGVALRENATRSDSSASAETRALDRLRDALSAVPGTAMPDVLNEANRWLAAAGFPRCSVESAEGELSLAVGKGENGRPLAEALSRCADAVERIMR
jgi:alkylated DNA nucleotide flippase Atl1